MPSDGVTGTLERCLYRQTIDLGLICVAISFMYCLLTPFQQLRWLGSGYVLSNIGPVVSYFIISLVVSIVSFALLIKYSIKSDERISTSTLPLLICKIRLLPCLVALIVITPTLKPMYFPEERMAGAMKEVNNSQIHQLQYTYQCCGQWQSGVDGPISIWRQHFLLGENYETGARNTSLPWSCCRDNEMQCAALGFEHWQGILHNTTDVSLLEDMFDWVHNFGQQLLGTKSYTDSIRRSISSSDCRQSIEGKTWAWHGICVALIIASGFWHLYYLISTIHMSFAVNRQLGNRRIRSIFKVLFPCCFGEKAD